MNVGRGAVFALTSRHPRTVLNGDPVAFVQSVTGFVAPKPQAAGFPIEAFGNDGGERIGAEGHGGETRILSIVFVLFDLSLSSSSPN